MSGVFHFSALSLTLPTCFIEFVERAAFPGENILCGFGPFGGPWLLVVVGQIVVDRGLKIIDILRSFPLRSVRLS
jgi:hypothetical protein